MSALMMRQRAIATSRARQALHRLERRTHVTRDELGTARDQVNLVATCADAETVQRALAALEAVSVGDASWGGERE